MANKTLLNCVNELLKRAGLVSGDADLLTTLTDGARQRAIDTAIQVVNEGIIDLYQASDMQIPVGTAEGTLTLATGTRTYAAATNYQRIYPPMIDRTNNQTLKEYPGGYPALLLLDPEQDDTGLPQYYAINPNTNQIYLDRAPEATENGNVYYYQYLKSNLMTVAADTVPFDDIVFTAMVPAWFQLWKRERRNEFDQPLYNKSRGAASRVLRKIPDMENWSPR